MPKYIKALDFPPVLLKSLFKNNIQAAPTALEVELYKDYYRQFDSYGVSVSIVFKDLFLIVP